MCITWIDGSPHEKDPRVNLNQRQWETDMYHAPCNSCGKCFYSCVCPWCHAWELRSRALQDDWTRYQCCQGYICPQCCATPDCNDKVQQCPQFCFFLEMICCLSFAISATRIHVQVERQITTDECDNRIIRFNNCIQILSCICQIAAIFNRAFEDLAHILKIFAEIVWCSTQACMQAQTAMELDLHPTPNDYGPITQQPGPMYPQHVSAKTPLMPPPPPAYTQQPPPQQYTQQPPPQQFVPQQQQPQQTFKAF